MKPETGEPPTKCTTVTLDQSSDLQDLVNRLGLEAWPEFLFHNDIQHWNALFTRFAQFQFVLLDPAARIVGVGHTAPLIWDGRLEDLPTGIDDIIERALYDEQVGGRPTVLVALAAIVPANRRGKGRSATILRTMIATADRHGLNALIAPVRPTWKSRHPKMPFDAYVRKCRKDGSAYDPWLRIHWRLGGERLAIAPKALVIRGRVAEWESWTGMSFPKSGKYVVPGALVPVEIDRDHDIGLYEEPNLWVRHTVARP